MRQQIRFLTHALGRRETLKYLSIRIHVGLQEVRRRDLGGHRLGQRMERLQDDPGR